MKIESELGQILSSTIHVWPCEGHLNHVVITNDSFLINFGPCVPLARGCAGLLLIENVIKLIMFTLSCEGWTQHCRVHPHPLSAFHPRELFAYCNWRWGRIFPPSRVMEVSLSILTRWLQEMGWMLTCSVAVSVIIGCLGPRDTEGRLSHCLRLPAQTHPGKKTTPLTALLHVISLSSTTEVSCTWEELQYIYPCVKI